MLARIVGFLVFLILIVYSVPIFYGAYLENRLLRASRHIASDIRELRKTTLSERLNHKIRFSSKKDASTYSIYPEGEHKAIRTVDMSKDFPGLIFISFTDKGYVQIEDKKTIKISFEDTKDDREDYVFLMNQRDYKRSIYTRITRVSWNDKRKELKVHNYAGSDQEGNIYFKEI